MDTFSGRQAARPAVRPAETSTQVEEPPVARVQPQKTVVTETKKKRFKKGKYVLAVLVLAVLVIGGWLAWNMFGNGGVPGVKSSEYQAVFLTNGQVYFGKLHSVGGGNYYQLTDIFYLQTSQNSTSSAQNPQTTDSANVQLIKLGSEIHGPEDAMTIAKDQVLFFENLKSDGKVAKTIQDYNNQHK